MRKGLLVVAALVLVGCRWGAVQRPVTARGPTTGAPGGDREVPGRAADRNTDQPSDFTRKKVGGKQEPSTILALDGTKCTVTADRYREIIIGELVWCAWTTG